MHGSAARLYGLLSFLFGYPGAVINAALPSAIQRSVDFTYDQVVVIAHSLGAVIARQALLNAWKQHEPWCGEIRLVLFAPAHKGARVQELVESVRVGKWLSLFTAAARYKSPLIDQLRPGSPCLAELERDIVDARRQ